MILDFIQLSKRISIPPHMQTLEGAINAELCSMMAVRVEYLRNLKIWLLNFMLKKTMTASEIMGNIFVNEKNNQTDNLTRLAKYQLPLSVVKILNTDQ